MHQVLNTQIIKTCLEGSGLDLPVLKVEDLSNTQPIVSLLSFSFFSFSLLFSFNLFLSFFSISYSHKRLLCLE